MFWDENATKQYVYACMYVCKRVFVYARACASVCCVRLVFIFYSHMLIFKLCAVDNAIKMLQEQQKKAEEDYVRGIAQIKALEGLMIEYVLTCLRTNAHAHS